MSLPSSIERAHIRRTHQETKIDVKKDLPKELSPPASLRQWIQAGIQMILGENGIVLERVDFFGDNGGG